MSTESNDVGVESNSEMVEQLSTTDNDQDLKNDVEQKLSTTTTTTTTTLTEGKATVTFPGESTVFYNPVQEFNRDLRLVDCFDDFGRV